ncbi:hypothetical protein MPER_11452, partial [Moniliophthora perniciosa FA553]
ITIGARVHFTFHQYPTQSPESLLVWSVWSGRLSLGQIELDNRIFDYPHARSIIQVDALLILESMAAAISRRSTATITTYTFDDSSTIGIPTQTWRVIGLRSASGEWIHEYGRHMISRLRPT